MHILIVDDEQTMLDTLRRGLRTRGFAVSSAKNGRDALNALGENSGIDLVLTDYSMAGMNGLELLKAIRHRNLTLPVIIMTAYGDKDIVFEAMKENCDGFIDKPFTLEELLEEIRRFAEKNTPSCLPFHPSS